jgi:stearoyl-CoA 9-desaturase NADPH oxidoreductase
MILQTVQTISNRLPKGTSAWINFGLSHLSKTWSINRIKAKVVRIQEESSDVKSFYLEPNGLWKGFLPGQHVNISLKINGRFQTRTFSFSSHPKEKLIRITIKKIPGGLVTNHIHNSCKLGDIWELGEATGDFLLNKSLETENYLFISGGSGITPILSQLKDLSKKNSNSNIILLYFSKSEKDILFKHELNLLSHTLQNFKVIHYLSEEENPRYNFGIFEESILKAHVPDFKEYSAFFCGPEALKRIVFNLYEKENILNKILSEDFGLFNQKIEEATELQKVKLLFRAREEEVGTTNILDSLLDKGVSLQHGCKAGICNTCACMKSKGRVKNLITGKISDDSREKIKLCVSVAMTEIHLEV